MLSVEKCMAWSKSSKKFAAKKEDVFTQNPTGVPHGSCNSRAWHAWLPFPPWAGALVTEPFLYLEGQQHAVGDEYPSLKAHWKEPGALKICRIASRGSGSGILNKSTFHVCIWKKKKSNWKHATLVFLVSLWIGLGSPRDKLGIQSHAKT